jgi:uncharacterized Zn-binding protein involved in type VI secretion
MSDTWGVARKDDLITHNASNLLRIGGQLFSDLWAAAAVAGAVTKGARLAFAFTPAGAAFLITTVVVEWAVSELVDLAAQELGKHMKGSPVPRIKEGSPNVNVNGRPAARGKSAKKVGDQCECPHPSRLMQGSQWVAINSQPVARLEDLNDNSHCSGEVGKASDNVFVGGPRGARPGKSKAQEAIGDLIKYRDFAKDLVDGKVVEWGAKKITDKGFEAAREALWGK